ncbi:hypothetical protein RHGRI_008166 [Rhododendron griersonianum]|uniref:Protein kinase domain-containing protein n=1 Tax=Rhododendron griersonianum TaxID=479676 RepID=A0AAV6L1B9_9ERIC|nr:hypothetical protein RHGRI_008166 [Rhododendron griersonianum]
MGDTEKTQQLLLVLDCGCKCITLVVYTSPEIAGFVGFCQASTQRGRTLLPIRRRYRKQYEWLVGAQYKPMEMSKSDWATIRKSPPWSIDSWGLGCLIYELFSGTELSKTEELRDTASIPKDSVEKDTFFLKLPNLAEQLPRQIVLKKLLPLLASSLEFGSAAAPALTALLKMGSWLSSEEFSTKVLPTIVKLFASNDRAIRVGLL